MTVINKTVVYSNLYVVLIFSGGRQIHWNGIAVESFWFIPQMQISQKSKCFVRTIWPIWKSVSCVISKRCSNDIINQNYVTRFFASFCLISFFACLNPNIIAEWGIMCDKCRWYTASLILIFANCDWKQRHERRTKWACRALRILANFIRDFLVCLFSLVYF